MKFLLISILLLTLAGINCKLLPQLNFLDRTSFLPLYRSVKLWAFELAGYSTSSRMLLEQARKYHKLQDIVPQTFPFPCNVTNMRSKERPSSVHKLRPGDIDVIGAMGDSLTAANGATASTLFGTFMENRGVSWSGGGQSNWREFLTLPNIIKEFNPNLIGYAYGDGLSIFKASQFNTAEPIGMSQDIPFMAKELVKRIKNDPRVNFLKDWKLITLMIGANNICADMCSWDHPESYPETRRLELIKTFRYIRDNMPRTVINMLLTPDIKLLTEVTNEGTCVITRHAECPCLFGDQVIKDRPFYFKIIREIRQVDLEVSQMPEFIKSDVFTVLLQTFTEAVAFPKTSDNKTDNSLFAPDCFHFSQKGHAWAANAIWNNLLQPIGEKSITWKPLWEEFMCPTESNPYIFTMKNSARWVMKFNKFNKKLKRLKYRTVRN